MTNQPNAQDGPMFEHQQALPKLPVPPLRDTLERFTATVAPLLNNETELEDVKLATEEILREGGWGERAQKELEDYAQKESSFVERFWDDAYLGIRGSLVTHVNPIFVLEDDPTPSRNNQIARASSLILSSLKFVEAIRNRTLTPDVVKGTPLCMSQFDRLFGSARIPDSKAPEIRDQIVTDNKSTHIAVICRGQIYYFDTLWPDGRVAITELEIANNLKTIVEDAETLPVEEMAQQSLGVLTSGERATWAKQRMALEKLSTRNAESLDKVDRALFVVSLDHEECPNATAFAANVLHGSYRISKGKQCGNCLSRWYDKMQFIVAPNGTAGVNFEHSAVDGHTVLRFASDAFTDTIIRFAQAVSGVRVSSFMRDGQKGKGGETSSARPDTMPYKLEFDIDDPLREDVRFAEASLSDEIVQTETEVLEFTGYGKRFIVQNKISPDAFVQLAIIMGYYDLYGSVPNVYESVQTKSFFHGRTEAGRSATFEALEYCKMFSKAYSASSPSLTCKGLPKNPSQEDEKIAAEQQNLVEALRIAAKAHSKMTSRCAKGLGVDRHLYAISKLALENHPDEALPGLFQHRAWKLLNKSIISTSNCGNPSLRQFGFGPVTKSGFGIGYIIKEDCLHFCVTSKHRQTGRYVDSIRRYLSSVHDLLILQGTAHRRHSKPINEDSHTGYGFFDSGDQEKVKRVGRRL